MILRVMLIYEIARHIHSYRNTGHTLSCTFPSGTGFVIVKLLWSGRPTKVYKFELALKPQLSIKNVSI